MRGYTFTVAILAILNIFHFNINFSIISLISTKKQELPGILVGTNLIYRSIWREFCQTVHSILEHGIHLQLFRNSLIYLSDVLCASGYKS